MAETLDCVVVGAGVVGLAVARSLALAGRAVAVLETEERIGISKTTIAVLFMNALSEASATRVVISTSIGRA